jgi:hypothetical protein
MASETGYHWNVNEKAAVSINKESLYNLKRSKIVVPWNQSQLVVVSDLLFGNLLIRDQSRIYFGQKATSP